MIFNPTDILPIVPEIAILALTEPILKARSKDVYVWKIAGKKVRGA